MIRFDDVFVELEAMGFFDWLLPFLLVFIVVFAILEKTMILGKENNLPRKNLNIVFALLTALILVVQTNLVVIMNTYLSKMAFFIVIALVALLAMGVFTGSGTLRGWPMFIGVIIAILAVFWALSPNLGFPDWWYYYLSDTGIAAIIILVVVIIVIGFGVRGSGGQPSPNRAEQWDRWFRGAEPPGRGGP